MHGVMSALAGGRLETPRNTARKRILVKARSRRATPAAKRERSPTPIGFSPMRPAKRTLPTLAKTFGFTLCALSLLFSGAALADDQKKSEPVPGINPDQSLSRQLDEGKGVIDPPPVGDAEIQAPAPAPNPGTTPVIPPPGTPGGDQSIQPK
jgi:hypothetical protein